MANLHVTGIRSFILYFCLSSIMTSSLFLMTYDKMYDAGVEAYRDQKWANCISLLTNAVKDYKSFRKTLIDCFLNCKQPRAEPAKDAHLRFYEEILETSNCICHCNKKSFGHRPEGLVTSNIDDEFERWSPYRYLQYCYQTGKSKKAAKVALTYHTVNQDVQSVTDKILYCRSLSEVKESYFIGIERKPYQILQGGSTIEDSKRNSFTLMFEKFWVKMLKGNKDLQAEKEWFAADGFFREDQCSVIAELTEEKKPSVVGIKVITMPEAIQVFESNEHYELSLREFLKVSETVRQFTSAYFNKTRMFIKEAKVVCREAENKEADVHLKCTLQEDGSCSHRFETEANEELVSVAYLTETTDELGQMYFIDGEERKKTGLSPKCGRVIGFKSSDKHGVNFVSQRRCAVVVRLTKDRNEEDLSHRLAREKVTALTEKRSIEINDTQMMLDLKKRGVKVVMDGVQLHGKERFVAAGLATDDECKKLIDLAQEGTSGDGYGGSSSPHTQSETFIGLGVLKAAQLASTSAMPKERVELFLNISELVRILVKKYFNLTRPLYFDMTHLVCRTAKGDDRDRSSDLSHPVHIDNCRLQDDGTCSRDAYSVPQRDYSAIMYLNDDFEGGEFFFAHPNKSEQVSLQPKCGRIVGFNSGERHGVKAVKKGQRCALAMWYTLDPDHDELARTKARSLLKLQKETSDTSSEKIKDQQDTSVMDVETDDASTDETTEDNQKDKSDKTESSSTFQVIQRTGKEIRVDGDVATEESVLHEENGDVSENGTGVDVEEESDDFHEEL